MDNKLHKLYDTHLKIVNVFATHCSHRAVKSYIEHCSI